MAQVKIAMAYMHLVLDTGELIRIEYQEKDTDDIYEIVENHMKLKDVWYVTRFELCSAKFMGMLVECVNMARVVAML